MNTETKVCQNCTTPFELDSEDLAFYQKIRVPHPTFCPRCRFQRRLLFWNSVNLYRRTCDKCKKFNISVYPPDAPYTVYCPSCWWGDDWDPQEYGQEYDFEKPFFEQLNELWHKVPLIGLSIDLMTAKTSSYNHDMGHSKDSYLIFHGDTVEDSAYGYYIGHSQFLFDCCGMEECQFGYDSMHSYQTNRCVGSRNQLSQSIECLFCRDSQNCQNCFASANLKNKQYYAWNKQLSKDEYYRELEKWDLGSYATYKNAQARAAEHWKTQMVKSEYNEFATNCTGPNIFLSRNTRDSIEVSGCEDSRYLFRMFGPSNTDCYDISMWGSNLSSSYEGVVVGENSTLLKFCNEAGVGLSDAEYCKLSTGGSHHFGCVGMKKGDYMIFNKQYSKEDYEVLVERIKKHMAEMPFTDARGNTYAYGEFFPPEISPFAYNTTLAQNFFPMDREEMLNQHFVWREEAHVEKEATIKAQDLPDHIKDAPDTILQEKIGCERCGSPYQIIEMELRFHRQMNLALPRICPLCRINEKINIWVKTNERNKRTCSGCGIGIESPYREEEAREVFCRTCYLARLE